MIDIVKKYGKIKAISKCSKKKEVYGYGTC